MSQFHSTKRKILDIGRLNRSKGKRCLDIGKYSLEYRELNVLSCPVNVDFDVCLLPIGSDS